VIAGLVLVAFVLTARFTHGRGPRAGYVLIVASIVWLVADKSMEGPTILRVDADHGLTAADLAGVVGLALGIYQAWPGVVDRMFSGTPRR
jgi:hypothetical protein